LARTHLEARLEDPRDLLNAALSGRYTLVASSAGVAATVYLAEDLRHQRQVGVKLLRPELFRRPGRRPSTSDW